MNSFMIVDHNRYETILTTVDESTGRLGFMRLQNDDYGGQRSIADRIYEVAKDLNIEKMYIDTMGVSCGIYDYLITRKQDRMEIIGLKGSRIMMEHGFNKRFG